MTDSHDISPTPAYIDINIKITTNMPFSPIYPSLNSQHHNLHLHLHLHEAENALSSLVLIALLTYLYTAFGKLFQPGCRLGRDVVGSGKQADEEARQKLGSPIYYSSPAAA